MVTLTINPIPSYSTVILSSSNEEQVDNSITVEEGALVSWSVACDGYETKTGVQEVTEDLDLDITLSPVPSFNQDYVDYLANLLIIQYHNKPKASATIKILAQKFPVDLILKIRDSFNMDTAIGNALDVLGKYVGVTRWYYDDNGEQIRLTDEEYRMLIKLKAISNTSNASHYDIDEALHDFFGNRVRATSDGNMTMTIFIPSNAEGVIKAAIQKRAMPTPLGVEANKIVVQDARFFGFINYQNQHAVYKTGFREYNEPDKEGETLNYDKVEEVERQ